jgi:hypothetical protein
MIMNRIFLLAAALFMAFSCHSVDPEIKVEVEPEEEVGVEIKVDTYVFHDDFLHISGGRRIELEKCSEDFYVVIRKDSLDAAKKYLDENGFTVVKELPRYYDDPVEGPSEYMALTVNGKNDVSSIPGSVYTNNLYLLPSPAKPGEMYGKSNSFFVKLSQYPKEEQLDVLNEYASQHNLKIVEELNRDWYRLACSNKSSGNIVEMVNWFIEVAGFQFAEPEFPEAISFIGPDDYTLVEEL